jgi:RNA polymerase primary sigma factor
LALEDKYDDIKKLVDAGKEKGYLTYDQVNELIPHDVVSPEDLDDLLTTIGTQGIDVLEGPKLPSAALDKKQTTPSACIYARWAPSPCSPAKAK